MFVRHLHPIFASLILLACVGAARADDDEPKSEAWKPVILEYLSKKYPGKTWEVGPAAVDTPEVRRAYSGRRFYMVLSHQPPTPRHGMPWPPDHPVLKAYQAKMTKFRQTKLSLILAMDADGAIVEYRECSDLARGLAKSTNPDDIKVAAAAVLTLLIRDEFGYIPVAAKDIRVTPPNLAGGGQARIEILDFFGCVSFGAQGELQSVMRGPRHFPP